jgi:hypothetical protein
VSAETEESTLLEAVIKEQLVKTQQTEDLECAVVICKVWRSAIALQLLVVTSCVCVCVCVCAINPISNPHPVYSHSITWLYVSSPAWIISPGIWQIPCDLYLFQLLNINFNLKRTIFRIVGGGVESKLGPLGTSATEWPNVPVPVIVMMENFWRNEDWQGKPKYSEKTCPSATLFTTNPTFQTRARTRAAAVGSQRLTAWAKGPYSSTNGSALCISICLTSLIPGALNKWEKWYFHLPKMLRGSASRSPSSSFTKSVLGWKLFLYSSMLL